VQKEPGRAPHQRFRFEQWASHLERDHDVTLEFAAFESPELSDVLYASGAWARKARLLLRDGIRRLDVLRRAREFDGIIVQREATMLGGAYLERALAGPLGKPLIYDFDDAIWQVAPSGPNGLASLVRAPWKVGSICRRASAVTVGNDFLASFARQYNDSVHIVRTSIDTGAYAPLPHPGQDEPFTIAWTGSHTTLAHLARLRSAIAMVAAARPTRLLVICDVPPTEMGGVPVDFVKWTPANEALALAPAHVGVMPLPDTLSARGKCGCKALQYMAVERPAVASPVGINSEIIVPGVNGQLASSDDEWVRHLLQLAADPEGRARMGRAGRATVLASYSAAAAAASFAAVVRAVVPAP